MKDTPAWRPGVTRRPRAEKPAKPPLSQEQLVQAALRIVRTDGVDGVSMRRLAAEFGTGPSSLYAHVSNKDELLQIMFDEVCGLVEVPAEPDPARWKDQVLDLARAGHRALLEHNDLARAVLATIPTGPNAMRITNAMLGVMLTGGVPPQIAGWAMDRIFLYITADAYEMSIWRRNLDEQAPGQDPEEFVTELSDDLIAYFDQVDENEYPWIRRHGRVLFGGGTDARFELGLRLLVDGLDKYLPDAGNAGNG
jgi:AcrR family transcriptional regulator